MGGCSRSNHRAGEGMSGAGCVTEAGWGAGGEGRGGTGEAGRCGLLGEWNLGLRPLHTWARAHRPSCGLSLFPSSLPSLHPPILLPLFPPFIPCPPPPTFPPSHPFICPYIL